MKAAAVREIITACQRMVSGRQQSVTCHHQRGHQAVSHNEFARYNARADVRGFFLYNTALLSIIGIVLVLSWVVPTEQLPTAMPVIFIGLPILALIILGAIYIRRKQQRSGR